MKTTIIAASIVLLTAATAKGESLRFVGSGVGSGDFQFYLNDELMRQPSLSAAMPTVFDVNLDEPNQTITYNRYELNLPGQFTVSDTTSWIIPGTLDQIDIVTTVTLNAFSLVAVDAGPLNIILTPPNELDVEDTTDGSIASFPLLNVSGSYSIVGPNESVSDTFDFEMGWGGGLARRFPQDELGVDDFPNSITIGHGNNGDDRVLYGEGQIIYSDMVEGFNHEIDFRRIQFRRSFTTILNLVPEPTTYTLALAALCLVMGRRRAL